MAWDDEKKALAVSMYESAEPTPENSMEVVKDLADELDESPNGVRMILTKAGVYIKKAAASKSASGGTASKRVSKQDCQDAMTAAITDAGQEADQEIISKLSGKAAKYVADVINAVNNG
jgi:ribosome recycling factor